MHRVFARLGAPVAAALFAALVFPVAAQASDGVFLGRKVTSAGTVDRDALPGTTGADVLEGLDGDDALEIALAISKRYGFQLRSDDENNVRIFASLRSLAEHIARNRLT